MVVEKSNKWCIGILKWLLFWGKEKMLKWQLLWDGGSSIQWLCSTGYISSKPPKIQVNSIM
jgi:hypothetical protein